MLLIGTPAGMLLRMHQEFKHCLQILRLLFLMRPKVLIVMDDCWPRGETLATTGDGYGRHNTSK